MSDFVWSVRVRATAEQQATVHARNNAFGVGPPLSFAKSDPEPTALEHFLGALAADIVNGFQRAAANRRVQLHDVELSATCRVNNALAHVGVIGIDGSPSVESVTGTLYVSALEAQERLEQVWTETLERSVLVNTLKRAVDLSLKLSII